MCSGGPYNDEGPAPVHKVADAIFLRLGRGLNALLHGLEPAWGLLGLLHAERSRLQYCLQVHLQLTGGNVIEWDAVHAVLHPKMPASASVPKGMGSDHVGITHADLCSEKDSCGTANPPPGAECPCQSAVQLLCA